MKAILKKEKSSAFHTWFDLALIWYCAALVIAFGLMVLRFTVFDNVQYWNNIVEAFAVAVLATATVGFFYEFRYTKKYFEKRFGEAISEALLWDTEFLRKREKEELEKGVDTLIHVLGGIDESQPEFGFGELIIENFIPMLGKTYREDFRIITTYDTFHMDSGHKVMRLTTTTSYSVKNSSDEITNHTLRLSGEYKRIQDIEDEMLYVLKRLVIDGREEPGVRLVPQLSRSNPSIMEFTFEKDIDVAPNSSRQIFMEEQEIIMENDMSTLFANYPINNLSLTVYLPDDCEPEVNFFAFGEAQGPRRTQFPRRNCEWVYPGWLLPMQGYAIDLYNRNVAKN